MRLEGNNLSSGKLPMLWVGIPKGYPGIKDELNVTRI